MAAEHANALSVYNVILKAHVTEKATHLVERKNKYTFLVNRSSTKVEIRAAVEELWNVHVESVRTINRVGKPGRRSVDELNMELIHIVPSMLLPIPIELTKVPSLRLSLQEMHGQAAKRAHDEIRDPFKRGCRLTEASEQKIAQVRGWEFAQVVAGAGEKARLRGEARLREALARRIELAPVLSADEPLRPSRAERERIPRVGTDIGEKSQLRVAPAALEK